MHVWPFAYFTSVLGWFHSPSSGSSIRPPSVWISSPRSLSICHAGTLIGAPFSSLARLSRQHRGCAPRLNDKRKSKQAPRRPPPSPRRPAGPDINHQWAFEGEKNEMEWNQNDKRKGAATDTERPAEIIARLWFDGGVCAPAAVTWAQAHYSPGPQSDRDALIVYAWLWITQDGVIKHLWGRFSNYSD